MFFVSPLVLFHHEMTGIKCLLSQVYTKQYFPDLTLNGQCYPLNITTFEYFKIVVLKGQSNEIYDLQLFSSFEPAWATDQWVKIVSFLVSFSPRYLNFYETPRSIILRGVKFRAVSYCLESCDFLVSYLIGHSKKITSSFFLIIRTSLGH